MTSTLLTNQTLACDDYVGQIIQTAVTGGCCDTGRVERWCGILHQQLHPDGCCVIQIMSRALEE